MPEGWCGIDMKVLLAGGGTAGHINPALSIAGAVRDLDSDNQILFIGKKGNMEEKLVSDAGYDMQFIDIEGLRRSLSPRNLLVVYKTVKAIADCKRIMRTFNPDAVICTGGYVSGPVMCAASALHIPSLIHEQNVYPGVTVRMSEKYARYIAISFPETKQLMHQPEKCVFTGNPVRKELLCADRQQSRTALGLDDRPFVLAFGGSLGAQKINEAVVDYIQRIVSNDSVQLLFGTGTRNYDAVCQMLQQVKIDLAAHKNIRIVPYIYNMSEAMAAADVVISRAGAISISEITALGKASILIPSPNVVHHHQETNAQLLQKHDAAVVIAEEYLNGQTLKEKIDAITGDIHRQHTIQKNARRMGVTDATQKLVSLVVQMCQK